MCSPYSRVSERAVHRAAPVRAAARPAPHLRDLHAEGHLRLLEKLLTVSSTVPTMVVAQPKCGHTTTLCASETQLPAGVGDGAEAMDV